MKGKITVHDVLSYASDVLGFRKEGPQGEQGWTEGAWHDGRNRVCLGAALRVAETQLFNSRFYAEYDRQLSMQPAIDAEKVLAEACWKLMRPEEPMLTTDFDAHRDIIVSFNDNFGTEDKIQEALELADKMVWERELENELAAAEATRALGEPVPQMAFADFITKK